MTFGNVELDGIETIYKLINFNLSKIMSNNEQIQSGIAGWRVAILVIIVALIAGTVAYFNVETIDKLTGYRPVRELNSQVDSTALEIQHELVEQTENPTIVEYLQFREDIREQRRIENVFLDMPTVVIIDILTQHGTGLSVKDIVQIYESYPETYNTIQSGARAQRYMDSIDNKKAENIPIDSVIDSWNLPNNK